jgi:hypothetical protein
MFISPWSSRGWLDCKPPADGVAARYRNGEIVTTQSDLRFGSFQKPRSQSDLRMARTWLRRASMADGYVNQLVEGQAARTFPAAGLPPYT